MPYSTTQDHPECSGWAVVKDDDDTLMGCHDTEAEAEDQITALNISESEEASMPTLQEASNSMDALLKQMDESDEADENPLDRVERALAKVEPVGEDLYGVPFDRLVKAVADELEQREEHAANRQKKSRVGERGHMQFKAHVQVEKKDAERGEFIFTGMGSVYGNKDQGGDIAQPGMMSKTINDNDGKFPLIADHDFSLKSRLGIAVAEETGQGVKTRNFVNLGTQFGKDVASHVEHAEKHGVPLGMSFGYQVVRDEWDEQKQARLLKEVKVYEFTLTQIPMNDDARVTSIEGATTE